MYYLILKIRFEFRNSKRIFNGIPIIASNMDTVGTFEMAVELAKNRLFTAIHKHYKAEEWINFMEKIGRNEKVIEN